MIEEIFILKNMSETVNTYLSTLSHTKCSILQIKKDVKELDNNFFLDKNNIYDNFVNLFHENAIDELIQNLNNFNGMISKTIDNCCNHEWIEDLIDLTPEKSKTIIYCRLCEVSKIF